MTVAAFPIGALTVVGILLVVLGLLAAGSIELIVVGVGALIAAAALGVIAGRRDRS